MGYDYEILLVAIVVKIVHGSGVGYQQEKIAPLHETFATHIAPACYREGGGEGPAGGAV